MAATGRGDSQWQRDGPAAATQIDALRLPGVPLETSAPTLPLSLTFSQPGVGQQIRLEGLDSQFASTLSVEGRPALPILQPGEQLHYTLYWRAIHPVAENYHSFLHLLDGQRQAIVKRDQLPGTFLFPPLLWNAGRTQREEFTLTIPESAATGLYTPRLGLYRHKEEELLLVSAADGVSIGDAYDLPQGYCIVFG